MTLACQLLDLFGFCVPMVLGWALFTIGHSTGRSEMRRELGVETLDEALARRGQTADELIAQLRAERGE